MSGQNLFDLRPGDPGDARSGYSKERVIDALRAWRPKRTRQTPSRRRRSRKHMLLEERGVPTRPGPSDSASVALIAKEYLSPADRVTVQLQKKTLPIWQSLRTAWLHGMNC